MFLLSEVECRKRSSTHSEISFFTFGNSILNDHFSKKKKLCTRHFSYHIYFFHLQQQPQKKKHVSGVGGQYCFRRKWQLWIFVRQIVTSVVQDANLTWNPPIGVPPDLTPCMENACLVWLPCAFLWLMLLPYIYTLKCNLKGRTPQPLTKFNIFKSVSLQ